MTKSALDAMTVLLAADLDCSAVFGTQSGRDCGWHRIELANSRGRRLFKGAAGLMLMVRETPLHIGHFKAMLAASEAGAIVAPPLPAFYTKSKSVDE